MKFIKLTRIDQDNGSKSPFHINPEQIGRMLRIPAERHTELWFAGSDYNYEVVTQTPVKILQLIAEAETLGYDFAGLNVSAVGDRRIVEASELAEVFGVGVGTVIGWIEDGMPIYQRNQMSPDTFNTADVFAWACGRPSDTASAEQPFFLDADDLDSATIRWRSVWYGSDPSEGSNIFTTNKTGWVNGVLLGNLGKDHHEEARNLADAHNHTVDELVNRIRTLEGQLTPTQQAIPYSSPFTEADLGLLRTIKPYVEAEREAYLPAKDVARLIELDWVCAVSMGHVLDAAEYRDRDNFADDEEAPVLLALTKTGKYVLEQEPESLEVPPEEAAMARLQARDGRAA